MIRFFNIFFYFQILILFSKRLRELYRYSPIEVRGMTFPGLMLFRPSFAFSKYHKNTIVCLENNENQMNIRADFFIQGLVENPEIWKKIEEARTRFITERNCEVKYGDAWFRIKEF